jgi:WD40 repeat protein
MINYFQKTKKNEIESNLWSGSVDSTIRVWNLANGQCLGVLSAVGGAGGHTDAISCLEFMPATMPGASTPQGEPYIASGSADSTVKIWKTNGTLVHTCNHSSMISALKCFKDALGGKLYIYIS